MTRLKLALAALAVLLSTASRVDAQADARDYEALSNLPHHTTAVWAYYRHLTAQNSRQNYTVDVTLFRATHLLRFGNWAFTPFDAILPVVDQAVYTPAGTVHQAGFGDPTFLPTLGYTIHEGKPEDLLHTYFAFTGFLTMPLGNYQASNPVNIGENRWVFKPHVVVGQRFLKAVTFEAGANVQIFGKNDSFYVGRAKATREQKNSINLELHLAVDLHESMFVSTSYFLSKVGEVTATLHASGRTAALIDDYMLHTMRFNWGVFLNQYRTTLLMIQLQQDLKGGDLPSARYVGLRFSHFFVPPAKK
ncbi:MAG TPA: transporter [Polyangiales bacterium]